MRGCNTRRRRKAMSAFSAPYSQAFSIGARASPRKLRPEPATSLKRHGLMAEKALGERIDAVVVAGRARVERVREQHRVVDRRDANAAHREHMHVELEVVADLEDARLLEQRLQKRDRFRFRDLVGREARAVEEIVGASPMADRDVASLSRLDRQREADELALQRVGRVRFGVDRDDALVLGARDPCAELRPRFGRSCRPCDRSARAPPSPARRRGQRAPCPVARPSARAAREQGPPHRETRLPPARLLLAPKAPRPGRPATPRGRRSAGPARSSPCRRRRSRRRGGSAS